MTPHDDPQATWERYALAWKATSAEEKRALLEQSLCEDCTYTDPLAQAADPEALVAYMLSFHAQVPGGHFVTRHYQFHHGRSVAVWDMVDGSGAKLGDGISFGEYAPDGRLRAMTGFFEAPEPAP